MLYIFSFITPHFSFLVLDSRSGMTVLQGSQIPFQFIEAHHCHPLGGAFLSLFLRHICIFQVRVFSMVRSGYSNQLKRELLGGDVASA